MCAHGFLRIGLLVSALVVLYAGLRACERLHPVPAVQSRTYSLDIGLDVGVDVGERGDPRQSIFGVSQGDSVTLIIRSNVQAEANLHGYERKVLLQPGVEARLHFVAREAGLFPLHLHQAVHPGAPGSEVLHIPVGAIEVAPR